MLDLTFITSNNEKLAHAKHLCRSFPVRIIKKKNYGIGYVEPRIEDRAELIRQSVEDATIRFKKTVQKADDKFFFIEDTSVIIESLSINGEYPGVDIKYWMKENSFASVDNMLKEANNDRRVTVRSDVVLVLNSKLRDKLKTTYKIFTSSVKGVITEKEFKIKTQPLYPWLNDKTFNKWFIPIGCNKPLSSLSIKQADKYDFRADAFTQMLTFLKDEGYLVSNRKYTQLELFKPLLFIICGPTCAGKTTLSTEILKKFRYYHIEASDFMYLSYYETHGFNSNVSIGDFAEKALKDNPSIVVNQIIENIKDLKSVPIVITGFRSPLEIESFKKQYQGVLDVQPIYVDAEEEIRFKRSVIRDRKDAQFTIENFRAKDEQQRKMGLAIIKDLLTEFTFRNNTTLNKFFSTFEMSFARKLKISTTGKSFKLLPLIIKRKKLQNIIISTLYKAKKNNYYTTTEIAHLITEIDPALSKSKNNVSRYFNQNYHAYFTVDMRSDNTACYKLSQTGEAYAKWLEYYSG